jgi:hypothetical protein
MFARQDNAHIICSSRAGSGQELRATTVEAYGHATAVQFYLMQLRRSPEGGFSTSSESCRSTNWGSGMPGCERPNLMACEAVRLMTRDISKPNLDCDSGRNLPFFRHSRGILLAIC